MEDYRKTFFMIRNYYDAACITTLEGLSTLLSLMVLFIYKIWFGENSSHVLAIMPGPVKQPGANSQDGRARSCTSEFYRKGVWRVSRRMRCAICSTAADGLQKRDFDGTGERAVGS